MQGGRRLSLFRPAEEVAEIRRVEVELGRTLSMAEVQFVEKQLKRNSILKIQVNLRSEEQKSRLTTLQKNIQHAKEREMKDCDPHLLIEKNPAKTPAQRMVVARAKRSEEEVDRDREAERLRKAAARAKRSEAANI